MIRLNVSMQVDATPGLLSAIFMDYKNWKRVFPSTIQQTELIAKENEVLTIRVFHKTEGQVINWLRELEPGVIRLDENKLRYTATFLNYFDPGIPGCTYTVVASIQLKGIFRLAAPFIKGMIKRRISEFTLLPIKRAAETNTHHNLFSLSEPGKNIKS